MKRSPWTVLCALALLLLWAMPVDAFEIGARDYYWFPGFKADMKSDGAGLSGTDIHAGYKAIRVHLDRNDFFLNADFAGPYLALTVSW
jgi:hypothetical protein